VRKVASAGDQDSLAESAWWLGNNDEAIQGVRRRRAERRLDGRSASPTGTMRSAGCGAFTVTSPALHSGSQLTPRTRTAAAVDGQPLEAYVGGQSGRVHRRLPLDARKRRALGLRFDGADRALVDVEQVVGAAVTGAMMRLADGDALGGEQVGVLAVLDCQPASVSYRPMSTRARCLAYSYFCRSRI